MFKMALLKHFMPIALSVCMVVQSVPATALAAEQTETVVEETQTAETETNDEDVEVSETTPEASKDTSTGGGYSDINISNAEISDENTSTAEVSEEQNKETEEETIAEETVEEASTEVEASEVQNTENDLMEQESASAAEDNMSITANVTETNLHSFYLEASLTGNAPDNSYFVLYYREKTTTGTEGAWERNSDSIYSDKKVSFWIEYYNDVALKDGATYEYVIGIGNSYNTSQDQLKASVKGEVTTAKDTRKLTDLGVSTGYSYATLSAKLTENTRHLDTSLYCYYREKTTENTAQWNYYDDWTDSSSYNYRVSITDLKLGTEYEYAIIVADDYVYVNSSSIETWPADRKVTGTFKTKAAPAYTLKFDPVETKCTSDTEVLTVTISGNEDDAKLNVTLYLNNESFDPVVVSLKQKANYTNTVTFEGLTANTEYKIVKADVFVTETIPYDEGDYDSYYEPYNVKVASIEPTEPIFKFTTKEIIKPKSISIKDSDKELKLNLEYDDYTYLEVTASDEGASTDVIWSSSDTSVVSVSNFGRVSANGVGEADIIATSVHDNTITAKRHVSVKDYQVMLKDSSGNYSPIYSIPLDKNSNLTEKITNVYTNIGFYDVSAGTPTLLKDFNVTSNKDGVANWGKTDDGIPGIATHAVGTTYMTFDKDGYKATISVSVKVSSKAFGITGLTANKSKYPAIDKGDNTYEIAYVSGITYTANGMISPKETFNRSKFNWTSSDETVATVSSSGLITPLKAGETTITVTPKDATAFTDVTKREFNLKIKELPAEVSNNNNDTPTVYALTNTTKTLADVKFPDTWGTGWEWKEPQTPLYNNLVNSSSYAFEAVYTGDKYYAYEGNVNVYIGTITGVYAYEPGASHNGVLVKGTDSLTLKVSPSYMGSIGSYTISTPTLVKGSGLTVTPVANMLGQYTVTAASAGKYTLNLEIKAGEQVVAVGKYNLTVVDEQQIGHITINSADETKAKIDRTTNTISFDFGPETKEKEFNLTAETHNRDLTVNTATKLNWTTTDKTVAVVTADKNDTHKATVTVKGDGHAVIQVTAADAAGKYEQLNLEIKDHAPRVEGSKATINTAFDYTSSDGRYLSEYLYGTIEVIPVYGEPIKAVKVVNEDGTTASTTFEADYNTYEHYCTIIPKSNVTLESRTYKCNLAVQTTFRDDPYTYPITVSVIDKKPKVTAKVTQSMNLFYITDTGRSEVKLENSLYEIEKVTWEDNSSAAGKGFTFNEYDYNYKKNAKIYSISQKNVRVKDGKLTDAGVDQGKLIVYLEGVKEPYELDIKIKYTYKKPVLKTVDVETGKNVSNLIPSMGGTDAEFYLYDSLKKHRLYYADYEEYEYSYYYNELICSNDCVELEGGDYIWFNYTGAKPQDTLKLTVDSAGWRERLTAEHKIKTIQPKAVLSNAKLTYNTNYVNEASAYIYLKDYGYVYNFTDVAIEGASAQAQELLNDDRLQLMHSYNSNGSYSSSSGYRVYARLNKLKLTNATVPSGSYAYNLTPYYTDQSGEKKALNTLKLTITFTDKPITAKVSAKGALDLAQTNYTSITMTPKFSNMGTGYKITNAKLTGEYSDYFTLNNVSATGICSLRIYQSSKLKAGHPYNLAIVYTVQTPSNETFTVTSNTIKITPKQTAPKVTVTTKPQNLYAANTNITRSYRISVPSTYQISSVSGRLDINKDGSTDLLVSMKSSNNHGNYAYLTVSITDKDAVIAATKGKSYSIPVTLTVTGRDGISKDASTAIKVNIKR